MTHVTLSKHVNQYVSRDFLQTRYLLCLTWHSTNTLTTMFQVTLSKHVTHYVLRDTL